MKAAAPASPSLKDSNRPSRCGLIQLLSFAGFLCAGLAGLPRAHSAEPIKIGAVLPFSGGVELYGAQAKLGLDLAAEEINAGGGILGRRVELIYEDDKTDPDAALQATREVISPTTASTPLRSISLRNLNAIAPAAESLKTPLLYATNYEGGKCSRYVFRAFPH